MFVLFFNIYIAMFTGTWTDYQMSNIASLWANPIQKLTRLVTSWFNQSTAITDMVFTPNELLITISAILSVITSIGIVVLSVKGIKKVFGIFFMGIRR